MENYEKEFEELEEMRSQAALLKNKLDQESIVTDEMLRKVMKRKANIINSNAWISVAASLYVIIWSLCFLRSEGFSLAFIITTIVMMLVCDFFTWRYHKDVNKKTMNGDLVTVAKVMKKLKKNYKNRMKYGISMLGIWFVWFAAEYCNILDNTKLFLGTLVLLIVGVTVGALLGYRMHKSVINNADEVIKQIEG